MEKRLKTDCPLKPISVERWLTCRSTAICYTYDASDGIYLYMYLATFFICENTIFLKATERSNQYCHK